MSLYPMQGEVLERILGFIETLTVDSRLEIAVNQMSTQIRGELDVVMEVLTAAMQTSFTSDGSAALVVKFLNADLPIWEKPELGFD
jgi:uncharacterized protein YqgV (UPF0045/DUF77 family)